MPKRLYSGQKLIKTPMVRIIAKIASTNAKKPVIIFVKYRTAIKAATTRRTVLSIAPIFFFMCSFFYDTMLTEFVAVECNKCKVALFIKF